MSDSKNRKIIKLPVIECTTSCSQFDYRLFCAGFFRPKVDDNADPNDSLMTMMKQMYDDGDDEMKRTIAKAWSESRNKQSSM